WAERDEADQNGATKHGSHVAQLASVDRAPVGHRPEYNERSDHQSAGGIPEPPSDPDRRKIGLSCKAGHIKCRDTDCGAEHRRQTGTDNREFCDSRGSYKSLSATAPPGDQVTTH